MTNQWWQLYFQALYPVWAVIAVLVALNYGRRARESWREAGGSWLHAGFEWISVVGFVIGGCVRDVWSVACLRGLPPESAVPMPYTPGHLLRFFVAMSFVQSAVFGVVLRNVDRTQWPLWLLTVTAVSVNLAMLAGAGHLFLAWRMHPRRWRWTVAGLTMLVPALVFLQVHTSL